MKIKRQEGGRREAEEKKGRGFMKESEEVDVNLKNKKETSQRV